MTTTPDQLIVPSLAETDPQELRELSSKTVLERAWYANHSVFETNEDILSAAQSGALTIVHPDKNFTPIGRLRNPELFHQFPPYLLSASRLALLSIGQLWRKQLQVEGMEAPDMTLAVTSLTRSDQAQQELVRQGKLAVPNSTHRVGAAFDIDASGYYQHDMELGYIPVVHPDRSRLGMQQAAEKLKTVVGHSYDAPEAKTTYDPRLAAALLTVTKRLHDDELINLVVEFVDQPNQCVHIAPNPNVDWANLL